MKNFVYLMMPLLFMTDCSGDYDDGRSIIGNRRPPFIVQFRIRFSGESSDVYKVSIQTLDKIEPKPTFHYFDGMVIRKEGVDQGAYETTMTDLNVKFNPKYVDKKRLLEIKIYKKTRLLKATTIEYTLRSHDDLYESGRDKGNLKKGDVLSLNQVIRFTYAELRIVDGDQEDKDTDDIYI